jgi:uncharacterized membrane protein YeaQ/YmgE (transglycosylase-associated protein family)
VVAIAPWATGMNSIPWLADVKELSGAEFFFLIVMVVIASLAIGFLIDVIAGNSGFGTLVNGALALIGACTGIYLRYRLFDPFRSDDLGLTIGMAIAGAFVLFFALVLARSRIL